MKDVIITYGSVSVVFPKCKCMPSLKSLSLVVTDKMDLSAETEHLILHMFMLTSSSSSSSFEESRKLVGACNTLSERFSILFRVFRFLYASAYECAPGESHKHSFTS